MKRIPSRSKSTPGYGDTIIVIVGLPDAAVKESRDRVMTALINSGFNFTFGRTTINLAPADVKKEGPSFDLPIAIGMLAASEQIETDQLENFVMVGELALTGAVRPVKGVLPIALRAQGRGQEGHAGPAGKRARKRRWCGLAGDPGAEPARGRQLPGRARSDITPTKVDIASIFDAADG